MIVRVVLIEPGSPWPPLGHADLRQRWQSWRAWWSGDLNQLKSYARLTAPGGYWQRRAEKPGTRQIHAALAGDIARTSAELVAGDTPAMEWTASDTGDTATRDSWDDLAKKIGWANSLLEAAECASPLGGVFLRPAWDQETAPHPLLTIVPADEALPEFRFGILRTVTFVTELPSPAGWKQIDKGEVWRWLEHHEPGQVRHELWLGTTTGVGWPIPLDEHPQTRGLQGEIDTSSMRPRSILVEYVPNYLPNPITTLPLGKSDLQGIETFLDALDMAWDSWMRDIDLGKAMVLLSREMLDPVAQGSKRWGSRGNTTPAAAFDRDAEVFVKLETPAEEGGQTTPITQVQFKIRFQEHAATVLALVEHIVSRAGFSPQTFGLHVEGQLSGTAMRRREHRSYRTRDRKRRYMRPPAERCAETLMLINAALFGGPKPTERPTLAWRETDQSDPMENAQVIELLRRAQAASDGVVVAMAHPEWDDQQIEDEVGRITAERAAAIAPPLTGFEPELDDEPASGVITPEQANVFGTLVRSGVDPQEAARQAWGGSVRMVPGATPVTIKVGEDQPPADSPTLPGR